ncbi:DNA adenine methylase [Mycoplasma sp. 394]
MQNKHIRSPLNHLGNKYRILDIIFTNLPSMQASTKFVDVFGGSFNVGINSPFKNVIYNEYDKALFEILTSFLYTEFDIIDKKINEKLEEYQLSYKKNYKENKEKYLVIRNDYNETKDIILLIILVFFSFNSELRFNKKGFFNVPIGKSGYTKYRRSNLIKFIELSKTKLIQTYNLDFGDLVLDLISKYKTDQIIFYFDPPYLISNATYNNNWSIDDEKRLIKILQKLNDKKYKFILSNFIKNGDVENNILKEFLEKNKNFVIKEVPTNYKSSNYQRTSKNTTEILVKNYEV